MVERCRCTDAASSCTTFPSVLSATYRMLLSRFRRNLTAVPIEGTEQSYHLWGISCKGNEDNRACLRTTEAFVSPLPHRFGFRNIIFRSTDHARRKAI